MVFEASLGRHQTLLLVKRRHALLEPRPILSQEACSARSRETVQRVHCRLSSLKAVLSWPNLNRAGAPKLDQLVACEPVADLEGRGVFRVGAVNGVLLNGAANFLRMVPSSALAGLVAPISLRRSAMALSFSRTIRKSGPEDMKSVRLSKNGLPR